jgi:large subunit ribosomal protein L10
VNPLAVSKERKEEVLATYADWMKKSQAVILVEYTGVKMKALDGIRAKIRESGGEFHIVKNTLARRVFSEQGMAFPEDYLVKSTAVSFAFTDPASTAKALTEATKGIEFIKVKGGFMAGQTLSSAQVKALAAATGCSCTVAGRSAGPGWQTGPHHRRTRSWIGGCYQGLHREGTRCSVTSMYCYALNSKIISYVRSTNNGWKSRSNCGTTLHIVRPGGG